MATHAQALTEALVFRQTNRQLGRHISVTPANSANYYLSYGRIILRDDVKSAGFYTATRETGLIVLSGNARVEAAGQQFDLARYDAIYVPRDSSVHIRTDTAADVAEFSAEVSERYPLRVIHYAETSDDPDLTFDTGGPAQQRRVSIVIGGNVDAGRLIAGFTRSEPGNWTGWPPHEHAERLEEMHVFFDMPDPAFGIQLVYGDTENPELVAVVRDGDAVVMPGGYHPNVAVPGHRVTFLWAMAAQREKVDRQFGVVNVQPGFSAGRE
jgi:5-deoxy-glucuronate isomerase